MYPQLQKFFHNQTLPNTTPLEQKLGSVPRVQMFASFYAQNAEALAVIAAAELYEYVSNDKQPVDTVQVLAFKQGLGALCKIFEDCYQETQQKIALESTPADDLSSDAGP